ncbi:hypothetical protein FALBO_12434 [Fusarium albosuccineum]|uniref:RED-like N-terminal domain-containing protein n=1 Tax=Fusarium albosuccineum TaxID=1237068 RepID=A0A8H4L3Z3_9HYPO|nr:hypothetical protein FALBO_12434 [Fusarium albosuccineum]
MNNEQFRKLMLANSKKSSTGKDGAPATSSSPAGGSALGSRQRSSIPMTPRSVGGAQADFARQLADRNNAIRPQKKFKSYDPKGVKLATGYVDRARDRDEDTEDSRAEKLKELEEQLKNEEIDQETFEKRRFEIAGGDLGSTHLVKGLDFKLLERIRRGDDIYGEKKDESEQQEEAEPNVDDEFDQLEEQEVQAVTKDKTEKKKGQLSTVSLAPGKKRTRDQILAELKAAREAAKAQQENALGDKFRKIGAKKKPGSRIERDSKGREVLIIIDEDGHEKRKVRKVQPDADKAAEADRPGLLMPDKDAKPLGMEVPEQYRKKEEPEEEEDDDIFEGVGDDYDPLAGMDGSDSDSDSDDEGSNKKKKQKGDGEEGEVTSESMPPPPKPQAPTGPRNYFQGSKTGLVSEEQSKAPSMSDPAIMAAIKRAAALNPIKKDRGDGDDEDEDEDDEAQARKMDERRKKLLQMADRDDEDLDMGFGTSRFADEEDFDDSRVKLSTWGDDGDDGEGKSRSGQAKRKRGPKKRKGDANNAADVLRVMEQRKKS